jgi:DNA-binding transcriptional regulator YiaG
MTKHIAYTPSMTPSHLKRLRAQLGLTQPELARAIGVHSMTVSKWETGISGIPEPVAKLVKRMLADRNGTKRKR